MNIVLATGNPGKLREFRRLLEPLGLTVLSQAEAGFDGEIDESGSSFRENAEIKARAVCEKCGLPAVADDSGLCVDALGGRPGIFSARYAEGSDDDRIDKILAELAEIPPADRTARFVCAACAVFPDGKVLHAEGICEGKIAAEREGAGGFGYDPIFISETGSFGLLTDEQKDAVSHRGKAFREIANQLECELNRIRINSHGK